MRLLPLLLLGLAACRAPSPLPKQPPFDFTARPGPDAGVFHTEATLLARWNDGGVDSLRTFWASGTEGRFTGVDGVEVVYRIHRATTPKAGVVLVPGRTEAIIKFAEVAQDLVRQGYSTYAVTLRGQGEAGRMLADREKGYVAWWDDYVTDTHRFITEVVKPEVPKVFMLAHSLGGAVAASLVDAYPADLQALALSAPMLEINLGGFPAPIAASLADGACGATDGSGYAIGGGPYTRETDFEPNTVTRSEARWRWKIQQLDDDPNIRLGGITWRWLCQALNGSSRSASVGRYSEVPTLLMQAGADTIVKPGGQERYCADAPRCTLVTFPTAQHELLQGPDADRNVALSRVVAFFDAQVTP